MTLRLSAAAALFAVGACSRPAAAPAPTVAPTAAPSATVPLTPSPTPGFASPYEASPMASPFAGASPGPLGGPLPSPEAMSSPSAPPPSPLPAPSGPPPDEKTLRLQVLLDRAHFSPGEIDGRDGGNTRLALASYKRERGQRATADASGELEGDTTPYLVDYTITAQDVAGPFTPKTASMI